MNSTKIKLVLKNKSKVEKNSYYLEKKYSLADKSPFGKEYLFGIKDTLYFGNNVSKEYLVDFDVLNIICQDYSLEPVYTEFFNDNYQGNSNITDFEYLFDYSGITLSEEEKEISALNSIFIFKKK